MWIAPVFKHAKTTGQTFIEVLEQTIAFILKGPKKSMAVAVKGGVKMRVLSSGRNPSLCERGVLSRHLHSRQSAAVSIQTLIQGFLEEGSRLTGSQKEVVRC